MKKIMAIIACILCFTATPVQAEEPKDESLIRLRVSGRHVGSADFKDSEGGAQVTSGRLSVDVGDFSINYTGAKYSWNDKQSLPFGNGNDDPWDTLHKLSVGYELNGGINDHWVYSTALTVSSAFEEEMSGSYGAALRAGFGYTFNDNWSARFGGRIFANSIETEVMPYLGLMYENYDKDGSGAFMTLGAPGSEAGYAFSKSSKIRASFELEGDTYRLKDSSTVARKGYMKTSSMLAALYYDWKPTDRFSMSFGPEYHFGRETQIYNSDGDKRGSAHKQDAAWGGRLQFRYAF